MEDTGDVGVLSLSPQGHSLDEPIIRQARLVDYCLCSGASPPSDFKAGRDVIFWNDSSWGSQAMKPKSPCELKNRGLPHIDYFFRSDIGNWRGYWPTPGDEGESARRRFYDFTREFLRESARERAKEMYVFAILVLTAAWPVGYMAVSVVKLLLKGHPLD